MLYHCIGYYWSNKNSKIIIMGAEARLYDLKKAIEKLEEYFAKISETVSWEGKSEKR